MLRGVALLAVLAVSLLASPLATEAQQAGSRRIGYLETSSPSPARLQLLEAFRQGLRELGYLEGKDIVFESRFGEGKPDQIQRFAAELVGLKVDVLVTSGTPASQAAKQATRAIPIVMTQLADPVGSGLVASLGHPDGNVTGLTTQDADLGGKRLELLLQVVPKISRLVSPSLLMRPAPAPCSSGMSRRRRQPRWACRFNPWACAIRSSWTGHSQP